MEVKKVPYRRGRPTTFKPKYCALLIEHMANGYSFESFGAEVGAGTKKLYDWVKAHEDFRDAKDIGMVASLKIWEKLGMGLVTGKLRGNASTWIFTMKNRFRDMFPEDYNPNEAFDSPHDYLIEKIEEMKRLKIINGGCN